MGPTIENLPEQIDVLLDGLNTAAAEHPLPALGQLRRLERATDELLLEAVTVARATGASWSVIGKQLGMSRQAAHERFRKRGLS